jgi:hypothetical protein
VIRLRGHSELVCSFHGCSYASQPRSFASCPGAVAVQPCYWPTATQLKPRQDAGEGRLGTDLTSSVTPRLGARAALALSKLTRAARPHLHKRPQAIRRQVLDGHRCSRFGALMSRRWSTHVVSLQFGFFAWQMAGSRSLLGGNTLRTWPRSWSSTMTTTLTLVASDQPERFRRQLRPAGTGLVHSPPSNRLSQHQRHTHPGGALDRRLPQAVRPVSCCAGRLGAPGGAGVPVVLPALPPVATKGGRVFAARLRAGQAP